MRSNVINIVKEMGELGKNIADAENKIPEFLGIRGWDQ